MGTVGIRPFGRGNEFTTTWSPQNNELIPRLATLTRPREASSRKRRIKHKGSICRLTPSNNPFTGNPVGTFDNPLSLKSAHTGFWTLLIRCSSILFAASSFSILEIISSAFRSSRCAWLAGLGSDSEQTFFPENWNERSTTMSPANTKSAGRQWSQGPVLWIHIFRLIFENSDF